jgi:aspartyl protease family protein
MGKDPWQVPDSDNKTPYKPSRAWQARQEKPFSETHVEQPKVLRLLVFLIGMGLLLFGLSLAFPVTGEVDPYLVRSVLILLIFGGAAAFWSRASLKKIFKVAGIWSLIIVGISAFYLYRSDFSERFMAAIDPASVSNTSQGLVINRSKDGHFWLRVHLNGAEVMMMVDTGASNVVLSPRDARSVGIDLGKLAYTGIASTANGQVRFARTSVGHFAIGDTVFKDVGVTVNGSEMSGSLMGMSVLNRFASFEFRGDTLILRP